jgi:hypothetical protein
LSAPTNAQSALDKNQVSLDSSKSLPAANSAEHLQNIADAHVSDKSTSESTCTQAATTQEADATNRADEPQVQQL